jgi:hypothetical protein
VFLVARHVPLSGDSVWYHLVGSGISQGRGFVNPSLLYSPGHQEVATAQFPPLYPAFLAVLDWVGVTSPFGHQVAGAIIGVSLVPLTALLARRLLGPVLALGAAIFVAVEPTLLAGDGAAMSETLAVPLLTLAVLLIYHARESARVRDWVLAGAVFGLVGLTRSEGPFLYVGIAGVTLLAWRKAAARRRLVLGLAGLAGVIILMLPWTVRNSVALGAFVPAPTNGAVTLGGGYCSGAFSGPLDGLWNPRCLPPEPPGAAEAAYAREQTRAALSFAGDHLTDLPRVATIRVFRVFGIYKPGGTAFLEAGETRNGDWQRAAGVVTWVFLPFAVAGIVGLVRARRRVAPLLGWGGTALVLVALTNGNGRQRLMFEPVLAILVAAAPLVLARRPRPEIPYVQEPEVVPSRELMSSR